LTYIEDKLPSSKPIRCKASQKRGASPVSHCRVLPQGI